LPRIASTLLGIAALLAAGACPAADFAFAAMGDMPYNTDERVRMERLLVGLAKEDVAFAVHVGDLKSGQGLCADAVFADRRTLLDASPVPLVLLPGDNDWTDCDRFLAGGYVPEERLAKLRALFFASPESLGRRRIALERDAAREDGCCPENARWWHEDVAFIALHVVGSQDNRGGGETPKPEFTTRRTAVLAWLKESFALARSGGARAVVVAIHANPSMERAAPRPAYAGFLEALRTEVQALERPVLLVHGDTHRFRQDRPWPGIDLVRVEVPGSPDVAWVRVRVTPGVEAPFVVEGPRRP
jgi:hypothetical protein